MDLRKAYVVYLEKPRMCGCEICDETFKETDFKYHVNSNLPKGYIVALDCCRDQLDVVDWREEKYL